MHYINAKSILSSKNGMNVYRGCTHGCIYCDSRSKCYGFSHDFEDIEVKQNAPELLEKSLKSKRKLCMIGTGSMCDPYMHCEKELNITRKCLELIDKYSFGGTLITKSDMVLRDLDLIKSINQKAKFVLQMTLTTFDDELCRIIEPGVCSTRRRYEVLKIMQENDIPAVVWLCPLLPYINDTEENLTGILNYCADAGVCGIIHFGFGLTLRDGCREYFYSKLDRHFPGLKQKYIRQYGSSYEIASPYSDRLEKIFYSFCKSHSIETNIEKIFEYLNYLPEKYEQLSMF